MTEKRMKRILVTGSVGQIGSELTMELRRIYGAENVIATGRKTAPSDELRDSGPFHFINVTDKGSIEELARKYEVDTIFHLAAILSAVGEDKPLLAWDVGVNGLFNVLEVARECNAPNVFFPSSIGAFGPTTPLDDTPQDTIMRPATMYGVTKVTGELLCDYYNLKFGLDCRGLRYPGLISNVTLPGGGTTDYAVAIYYEAILNKKFTCNLGPETSLDMMYMPDALKAAIDLMETPREKLTHFNAFNVTAMSFNPEMIAAEIRKHIPDFEISYEIDPVRQRIADSWPNNMDDSAARREWGWKPEYDLGAMTEDMLRVLTEKHKAGTMGYEG
jgi:nucleoside-diphosphate-sugar epimerase